ncbi:hypothetical protein KTAU_24960 [Thermogemmatispora aurantia]|uniref:Uncharacterized protein n=1 Tax=Thermogemmatispora aurantia TaxID=2045279 RepID=A0A5J4KAU1_9CHLR|nr:hypothetical protein KTAU_24960 [Thermogemmatispora aurantia]
MQKESLPRPNLTFLGVEQEHEGCKTDKRLALSPLVPQRLLDLVPGVPDQPPALSMGQHGA